MNESIEESNTFVNAASHEDINFLTLTPIISQYDPGIQVYDPHYQNWPTIDTPSGLLVHVGDMLQEASHQHYTAAKNRTILPKTNQRRITLQFYLHPRNECHLSKQRSAGSCLDQRYRVLGLAD